MGRCALTRTRGRHALGGIHLSLQPLSLTHRLWRTLTTQVLDPLDDANNAGKGCYRFCQVQALFRAALAAAASAAGDAADRAVASGQAGCAPSAEWNRREWAIEG